MNLNKSKNELHEEIHLLSVFASPHPLNLLPLFTLQSPLESHLFFEVYLSLYLYMKNERKKDLVFLLSTHNSQA